MKPTYDLRGRRKKMGMTLQQVADKSGLTWATVQAVESGRTPGTFMVRKKLTNALGIPFRALMNPEEVRAIFGDAHIIITERINKRIEQLESILIQNHIPVPKS